ncbi:hydroxymethylbilane synthase [Anaerolineales bacterium]
MKHIIRLGTRGSALALWRTQHISSLLKQIYPHLKIEIKTFSTEGDRNINVPTPLIGKKGLFTSELEDALREGEIDLAVHSLKDLTTRPIAGLCIGAIPQRENPADVLYSQAAYTLDQLPLDAIIGTSSNRRMAQLLYQRPDLKHLDLHGSIDTRIRKALCHPSPYDAIVLAYVALKRLRIDLAHATVLTFEQMLPAPGQGALAIQCRDEAEFIEFLKPIEHLKTRLAVSAERAFLAKLGGGCSIPLGALAYKENDHDYFTLRVRINDFTGQHQIDLRSEFQAETIPEAIYAGELLAEQAFQEGLRQILQAI